MNNYTTAILTTSDSSATIRTEHVISGNNNNIIIIKLNNNNEIEDLKHILKSEPKKILNIIIILGFKNINNSDIGSYHEQIVKEIISLSSSLNKVEIHYYYQNFKSNTLINLADLLKIDEYKLKENFREVFFKTQEIISNIKNEFACIDDNYIEIVDYPHKIDFSRLSGHFLEKKIPENLNFLIKCLIKS